MRLKPFEVDAMLTDLYDAYAAQLSPWESQFCGSVQLQWRRRKHLSGSQEQKLTEIWQSFLSGHRSIEVQPDPYDAAALGLVT